MCLHTKFHANRTIFGEIIKFHKFSRWRQARSRDIIICNSGPHTKSPGQRNISHMWVEAPANDIATKFGTGRNKTRQILR